MIAKIKEQDFRITLAKYVARITKTQDVSPTEVKLKIEFLATHWSKKEMQFVAPDEGEEPVETEVEVFIPMASNIVVDEKEQVVPYDLYDLLFRAISTPSLVAPINVALEGFNALFYGSMEGFNLQIDNIELG